MNARVTVITALAGAMLLAYTGAAAAAPQYIFSLLGGAGSSATAINNAGQITGSDLLGGSDAHAVVWSGTSTTDLGSAGHSSLGSAINGLGQVAGSQDSLATKWNGGQATTLPTLGINNTQAYGINNAGTVVGYADAGSNQVQRATIWNGNHATALASLGDGSQSSAAYAINTAGTVAGFSSLNNGDQHAVTWSGGAITDLGTLGGTQSAANAINDAGVVAGFASTAGDATSHAVLWKGGAITDLGTAGMDGALALGLNNVGQTVGYAYVGESHAILWNGATAIDLNSYLSAGLVNQGWVLEEAYGINDKGQIIGDAFNNITDVNQAFVLTSAVPEADAYAMLLAGLALVGWTARRRKAA